MSDIALITTTINVPELLMDYARDAKTHGRTVKFCVSGDQKTPPAAADFCARVTAETGVECEYMDVAAQRVFMRDYPLLDAHLPWNCVQRRNVALLKAVRDGAQTVITIDDDNFIAAPDYFGGHLLTGHEAELDSFGETGQWFNICRFLREENGRQFFARGYGMAVRAMAEPPLVAQREKKFTAVNAGLWLGDPDIDAITRLAIPVNATEYMRADNFFVAAGAWTPFNSQNTALARAALPAYFLSPFVGRFEDIFISFIIKRIADHLGHGVCFGQPLVRQDRNAHDLLHDLALENLGMKITDRFVAALQNANLQGASYAACLLELCEQAEASLREETDLTMAERAQLAAYFAGCRVWAELPLWD